jgi:hypothetical protein
MNRSLEIAKKTAYWKPIIEELETSGENVAQFARNKELPIHQLKYWKQKLDNSKTDKRADGKGAQFIRLITEGVKSKHPDPKWLAEMIKEVYYAFNQ